jgi:hypothetical protein
MLAIWAFLEESVGKPAPIIAPGEAGYLIHIGHFNPY